MNALLQTYDLLFSSLQADPQLSLANAIAWFDPLWQDDEDDWDLPQDEDTTLAIALRITRKAFPEVYAQAIERIRQGASYCELDEFICTSITEKGIPVECLELMGFGIPIPAYGAELENPEFYKIYPDVEPIMACFGISVDTNVYQMDIPDCVYQAGRLIAANLQKHDSMGYQQISLLMQWLFSYSGNTIILCGIKNTKSSETFGLEDAYIIGRLIADDLENHSDNRYQQVSWLLKWLFSSTNNSCVDWDEETMYSVEPLSWEPQDVAFAVEIIAEAESIMADAMSGLQWLIQTPQILLALWQNVTRVRLALAKQAKKTPRFGLTWPDPTALPPLTLPEYLSTESS